MELSGRAAGWLVGLIALSCLISASCRKPKPKPLPPPATSAAHTPCDGGESRDPPHHEARPAIQALRNKDYATAQGLFDALMNRYPESASLRVWRGDALLGQDGSAAAALAAYAEARALDAQGCKLRERERYFLSLGIAEAQLAQKQPEPALAELAAAQQKWPDSAEVFYQRARAECLQGKRDDCFNDLENALKPGHSEPRVRLSRAHHASENLLERAESQAEFADLRKEPKCKALFANAARSDAGTASREE
jgi:tetratricopeptide (TPR) repeat protein